LWGSKDKMYEFAQVSVLYLGGSFHLPSHDREMVLMLHLLKLTDTLNTEQGGFEALRDEVVALKKYVSGNWVSSKIQEELLTSLLGHWLIKPCVSYDKIHLRVARYVHLRAEWLHLAIYVTDLVARAVVDRFLRYKIGQMKSTYRKEILASVKDKKKLNDFAHTMLVKYHCPIVPLDPPQYTLAVLAFLRSVATEMLQDGDEKRYWRKVETKLADLHSEDHNGEDCFFTMILSQWELDIIAKDRETISSVTNVNRLQRSTSSAALAPVAEPPTLGAPAIAFAQDMEANTDVLDSSHVPPSFSLYGASAVPHNFPAHTFDSDVQLDSLGDIASTIESAL
ncbi:hypothetical protein DICSQDRAFT_130615, partial [Dichomitus squalens LYAD-421 SS1]